MDEKQKADLMDVALRTERDRLKKEGGSDNILLANLLNTAALELEQASKARLHDIIKRYDTAEEAYAGLIEDGYR
jgi:hypothetical protein